MPHIGYARRGRASALRLADARAFGYHRAMSLRLKIAIGVLAATAVLAAALGYLGIEAKSQLDRAADLQREKIDARIQDYREEVHRKAVNNVEDLVVAWVRVGVSQVNLPTILRDP